jgi:hypothetical protein
MDMTAVLSLNLPDDPTLMLDEPAEPAVWTTRGRLPKLQGTENATRAITRYEVYGIEMRGAKKKKKNHLHIDLNVPKV